MSSLIILEGPDGVGKTSLAQSMSQRFDCRFMRQPSSQHPLGFIRDIVKANTEGLSSLERQLLHTCSHIYDLIPLRDCLQDIVIMDRSPYSGFVYGKKMLAADKLDILERVNIAAYREALHLTYSKVAIIFVNSTKSLKEVDNSFYEKNVHVTAEDYDELAKRLSNEPEYHIHENLRIFRFINHVGEQERTENILFDFINNFINS